MSDMLYFIFDARGGLYGGPYRDEAPAKRMAETWSRGDEEQATVIGVPVMYLAVIAPDDADVPDRRSGCEWTEGHPSEEESRLATRLKEQLKLPWERALDLARDVLPTLNGVEVRDQEAYDEAIRKHLGAYDAARELSEAVTRRNTAERGDLTG